MIFHAFWLSIPPIQHFWYFPAMADMLSLRLELAFLPQWSLYPHSTRSFSLCLLCSKCLLLIVSPSKASSWNVHRTLLTKLGPILPPSRSCLDSLDNVIVVWIAWSICRIRQPEVAKYPFTEHWPLFLELTVLFGEMSDVARYGPYGGKLCLSCEGWYIWSTWVKQNLRFDCHFIGNSNANPITWLDG